MDVVVLVPAPALRRDVEGREGAVVVVAVVTGRGLGRLELLVVVVVAVGRVRVDVVGGVGVAVVVPPDAHIASGATLAWQPQHFVHLELLLRGRRCT